jgi:hypothetical protein
VEQASSPAPHGGWVWRPRGIGDVRNRSFPATVGSAPQLPGLLPAVEAVDPDGGDQSGSTVKVVWHGRQRPRRIQICACRSSCTGLSRRP